jgi:hypothetical protein
MPARVIASMTAVTWVALVAIASRAVRAEVWTPNVRYATSGATVTVLSPVTDTLGCDCVVVVA